MKRCFAVPAAAWQLLATARWEQLRKAKFDSRLGRRWLYKASSFRDPPRPRCFDNNSEGAEGAGGLLSALSRCQHLQDARSAHAFASACSFKASDSGRAEAEGANDNRLQELNMDFRSVRHSESPNSEPRSEARHGRPGSARS